MFNRFLYQNPHLLIALVALLFIFSSCKDEIIEQEMKTYCDCLDKYKYDPEGRLECIDLITALQEKYADQPRKRIKMIELSDDCN